MYKETRNPDPYAGKKEESIDIILSSLNVGVRYKEFKIGILRTLQKLKYLQS